MAAAGGGRVQTHYSVQWVGACRGGEGQRHASCAVSLATTLRPAGCSEHVLDADRQLAVPGPGGVEDRVDDGRATPPVDASPSPLMPTGFSIGSSSSMKDTSISPMSALTVIGYSSKVVFKNPPFRWSGSPISRSAVRLTAGKFGCGDLVSIGLLLTGVLGFLACRLRRDDWSAAARPARPQYGRRLWYCGGFAPGRHVRLTDRAPGRRRAGSSRSARFPQRDHRPGLGRS